jgi:hypothetical protein
MKDAYRCQVNAANHPTEMLPNNSEGQTLHFTVMLMHRAMGATPIGLGLILTDTRQADVAVRPIRDQVPFLSSVTSQ